MGCLLTLTLGLFFCRSGIPAASADHNTLNTFIFSYLGYLEIYKDVFELLSSTRLSFGASWSHLGALIAQAKAGCLFESSV